MLERKQLVEFLNHTLEIDKFQDYGPNGLQIEGAEHISKIAFAVSATAESIEKAASWGAHALVVHHGLFWKFHGVKTITGPFAKRIVPLIKNEINLIAYHLPLDAHPLHGNAAGIANALGLTQQTPFGEYKREFIGLSGQLPRPLSGAQLKEQLATLLNHPIVHADPGNEMIKNIGIITGGANNEWAQAHACGLDAFLTGEISEYNWHDAKEAGVHFFAGGHHATERFGVLSLQKLLAQEYGSKIATLFIDSENPA